MTEQPSPADHSESWNELRAAFWEYEHALMANDLEALDRMFAPGPDTLCGDAAGVLLGHDAISEFRRGRASAPARNILAIEVRELSDDAAVVVAVTEPLTGGRGQQTQLWRKRAGSWLVAAAHVAVPAPAVDTRIWRTIGTPLVPGADDGPLLGETVAVKDLFEIEGYRVGAGIPAYLAEATPAAETAPAVADLLAAGATIVGIARTDEFAYSIAGRNPHYGTPPNPAVLGGVPGGSSSGPASAVATGQASIGLGTDTAGSIRVPASYQGLWGLRTTHGAVSRDHLVPLAPSFDSVGWLTRDAATLRAAAVSSLVPSAQRSLATDFVVAPAVRHIVEESVWTAFDDVVGGRFDSIDLGDLGELFLTFRTVQSAEAWKTHGDWIRSHPGALGDDVAARFAFASTITAEQEEAGRTTLGSVRKRLDDSLGDRVLLLPSASSIALSVHADPDLIERTRRGTLSLTSIAGLTGRPALSVPALTVPRPGVVVGAPVGLGLVGPRHSDLALIDLAQQLLG